MSVYRTREQQRQREEAALQERERERKREAEQSSGPANNGVIVAPSGWEAAVATVATSGKKQGGMEDWADLTSEAAQVNW